MTIPSSSRPSRLRGSTGSFELAKLRTGLKPYRLYFFPRLRSTNEHAAKMRRAAKLFAPAAVLTTRQIAGRGRGKNNWWSAPGVLTVTFAIPLHERLSPHELPLIAGLSLRDAVAEITAEDQILLKWPNDLLHNHRKLAGLLCERISNVDLIGIGLNVNVNPTDAPSDLREQITSLSSIAQRPFNMTDVLIAITRHLRHNLRRRMEIPFSSFVREYSRHDALINRRITVSPGGNEPPLTGIAGGIDSTGRLLLRQRGKIHRIVAGMVSNPTSPSRRGL
jgi:BirA family transcriptional regulator, biotin operon repressor / biotin---[acetyl-CoA-carboxylase] ligase